MTDGSGTTLVEINDGADGAVGKDGAAGPAGPAGPAGTDGFSPTVTVSKSGKVATITVTDKNGTTTAEIRDGADGSGSGDMSKATYDADNDGIVDDAAKLGGQAPDYYAKAADIANKQDALVSGTNIKTINNKPLLGAGNLEIKLSDLSGDSTHRLVTDAEKEAWGNKLDSESDPTVPDWAKAETKPAYTASEVGAIPVSDKGAAGGVASLDAGGKVPESQLPAIGTGDMTAAVYDPAGGAKQVAFADELSGYETSGTAAAAVSTHNSNSAAHQTLFDSKANISHTHGNADLTELAAWAKASTKPSYTYTEVGAAASSHSHTGVYEPAGAVSTHNSNGTAHQTLFDGKQAKITASGILKGDGSGEVSNAEAGTDYVAPSALDNYIPVSGKGTAGGVASLGTDGKVPERQLPVISAGDMTAAVYDPAGGAKQVAFADELSGKQAKITASGILKGNGSGGISAAEAGTDYVAPSALSDYIPASQKGVATGVATLNGNALVTPSQLFSGMVSANASKTLTADDFGTLQEVKTPSAITITLPTRANTVIGAEVEILLNASSGEVTITPPTGVTLNGASESKVMSEAYGIAVLKCVGNSEWIIKGDIS